MTLKVEQENKDREDADSGKMNCSPAKSSSANVGVVGFDQLRLIIAEFSRPVLRISEYIRDRVI